MAPCREMGRAPHQISSYALSRQMNVSLPNRNRFCDRGYPSIAGSMTANKSQLEAKFFSHFASHLRINGGNCCKNYACNRGAKPEMYPQSGVFT